MPSGWARSVEGSLKASDWQPASEFFQHGGATMESVRILLVEDDALLARSLARGLGAEGYAVDLAVDGTDGLYLAQDRASGCGPAG